MDAAIARRRLTDARVGRLGTVTPDGRPHLVPCCFAVGGGDTEATPGTGLAGTIYSAVDAKPKTTQALRRLANIAANPAASLLVDHYDEDWSTLWWIRVDGRARVLAAGDEREHADALDRLQAKYEQYRENPPPGPVVAVDITGWRAWP